MNWSRRRHQCLSCLNFWDEPWWFLSLRVFGLLSSSLLGFFFSQRFVRCILRPSSGVPCLSGHRNDLTWEIILKIWLLIKQGVQELWRSFANNDVIVFHAYPRSITRSLMRWFLSVRVFGLLSSSLLLFFFYLTSLIIGSHIVFISIFGLLSRSLQPTVCAGSLRRLILQCSPLSIISTSFHKGRWFPFPFICSPPYPTFQSHLVLLPSDLLLALLLVSDLSHLCIFYYKGWSIFYCKGWSKHSSLYCWILLAILMHIKKKWLVWDITSIVTTTQGT